MYKVNIHTFRAISLQKSSFIVTIYCLSRHTYTQAYTCILHDVRQAPALVGSIALPDISPPVGVGRVSVQPQASSVNYVLEVCDWRTHIYIYVYIYIYICVCIYLFNCVYERTSVRRVPVQPPVQPGTWLYSHLSAQPP
jgi:hypothetical protein